MTVISLIDNDLYVYKISSHVVFAEVYVMTKSCVCFLSK